jgi:hypothetical protein
MDITSICLIILSALAVVITTLAFLFSKQPLSKNRKNVCYVIIVIAIAVCVIGCINSVFHQSPSVAPTPTPTQQPPSPTPKSSISSTESPTATSSATATATPTSAPTATPIPTTSPLPTVTLSPTPTATPTPIPIFAIDLIPVTGTHVFPPAIYHSDGGYELPDALEAIINNAGNQPTGTLSITLSGANSDSFNFVNVIDSIPVGGYASFPVNPKSGLSAGTHTATVTVSGTHSISKSFTVSFTVNKAIGGAVSGTMMMESFRYRTITVSPLTTTTGQNVEYAISTSNDGTGLSAWQSSRTFIGLDNRNYYVYARSVSNNIFNTGSISAFTISSKGLTFPVSLVVTMSDLVNEQGFRLVGRYNGVWETLYYFQTGRGTISTGTHNGIITFEKAPWTYDEFALRWDAPSINWLNGARRIEFSTFSLGTMSWNQFVDGTNYMTYGDLISGNPNYQKSFVSR